MREINEERSERGGGAASGGRRRRRAAGRDRRGVGERNAEGEQKRAQGRPPDGSATGSAAARRALRGAVRVPSREPEGGNGDGERRREPQRQRCGRPEDAVTLRREGAARIERKDMIREVPLQDAATLETELGALQRRRQRLGSRNGSLRRTAVFEEGSDADVTTISYRTFTFPRNPGKIAVTTETRLATARCPEYGPIHQNLGLAEAGHSGRRMLLRRGRQKSIHCAGGADAAIHGRSAADPRHGGGGRLPCRPADGQDRGTARCCATRRNSPS